MRLKRKDIEAIIRNPTRIQVYYQPIIDLLSGRLWGYEALVRGKGVLSNPGRLFRAAYAVGLLGELDASCFKLILAKGLPPDGKLCLNVTGEGLAGVDVSFAGPRLVLELTEYGTYDLRQLLPILEKWREKGTALAIDDVGGEVTQIRASLYFQPDLIKINRSLVSYCDIQGSKRLFLEQILEICRYVGAETVAEGIERVEELEVLRGLGIKYGQGYLLGKPQPCWVSYRTVVR
ncbi:MAG: EAL domain-containing protein [Thermanaeromonas sp.]|uniref:EAL domain-containing protein n=1 Tax=Thermanaeromonas sp. TaxID=2003697 RepID=UPI00243B2689|nr:EAL domain-containing protein [Thermanaeromonas sp.]MCG0278226.1 EAL domain-containing protein [Thermanaeromonas sp.]